MREKDYHDPLSENFAQSARLDDNDDDDDDDDDDDGISKCKWKQFLILKL